MATPPQREAPREVPPTATGDGPPRGGPPSGGPPRRGSRRRFGGGDGGGPRPRLRKLRLFLLLLGLAILAVISTAYGMMLAVASDVPLIENQREYANGGRHNSYLYDDHWRPIGIFAASTPEVIDTWKGRSGIARPAWQAVLAVEDKRFWSSPGVDIKGIARAFMSDVTGGPTQGASTITEQFVKNALQQQGNRTILEKLREAALAFHLTHKWSRVRILTEYLNSVYFGNGAYGIESAARVYFGKALGYNPTAATTGTTAGCGDATAHLPSCASKLNYVQAALLAGMIADPAAYDPITNPRLSKERRNLVLRDMLQQRMISRAEYETGRTQPVPTRDDLQPPSEPPAAPYFTSWLRPQILAVMGDRSGDTPQEQAAAQYRAYYGGLKIRTTLDMRMQEAADQAVSAELPYGGPNSAVASLVTLDNRTGEVRAMVGGPVVNGQEDYGRYPFNLATEAERQPGSSFKPFTLAVALEHGFGPGSLFVSAPLSILVPNSRGKEVFHVRNFANAYSGVTSLQSATDVSDNSVFERLGWYGLGPIKGVHEVRALAQAAGIQTPISTNPSMILGGLTVGVNPLEMAQAYETFADGGRRVFDNTLGSPDQGPTGIAEIKGGITKDVRDVPSFQRVMPAPVAAELHSMLAGVVQSGTGTAAGISGVDVVGKTGTTTNYADAWFVGWTPQLTTAVWVGFPNKLVPMTTMFNGGPVEGGTYPALIWHAFMTQALQILASEQPVGMNTGTTGTTGPSATVPVPSLTPATTTPGPATTTTTPGAANGTGNPGNNATGQAGGGTPNTGAPPAPGAGAGTGAPTGAGGGGTAGGAGGGGAGGGGTGGGSGSGSGGAGIGGGH